MPLIHYSCSIFLLTVSSWLPVMWTFSMLLWTKRVNCFKKKKKVLLSSVPKGEGEGGFSYWATLPWPIKSLWPVDFKSCFCSQMAAVSSTTSGRAAFSWERQFPAQTLPSRSCPSQLPAHPSEEPVSAALPHWPKETCYVSSAAVTIIWKCAPCAVLFLESDLCGKVIVLL